MKNQDSMECNKGFDHCSPDQLGTPQGLAVVASTLYDVAISCQDNPTAVAPGGVRMRNIERSCDADFS